jgi:hypothetical protein
VGLGLIVLSRTRLRRFLSDRIEVADGPLRSALDQLCRRSRFRFHVHLTCSSRIRVPLALGIVQPEICLPHRAFTGLTAAQQASMLGHELAHLERRDPAWLALAHTIECLFFFQPLNRLARRRLQERAEYACDARAAELAGEPLALAGCLARVAEWSIGTSRLAAFALAKMAEDRSSLADRIDRLLKEDPPQSRGLSRSWRIVVPVVLMALVAVMAPGMAAVSGASHVDPESPSQEPPKEESEDPGARDVHRSLFEALAALDAEASLLEQETAALKMALENSPHEDLCRDLIEALEQKQQDLLLRRRELNALADAICREFEKTPDHSHGPTNLIQDKAE